MKRPDEDLRRELEEHSPQLLRLKEEEAEVFQLPPQYFEHLQNEVWEKITVPQSYPAKTNWWQELWTQFLVLSQPRWALSVASVIALLVCGTLFLYQNANSKHSDLSTQLAGVDAATLNQYLQNHLHELDTETLLEFANSPENSAQFEGLNPEELQQYLDGAIQDLDLETLQELL